MSKSYIEKNETTENFKRECEFHLSLKYFFKPCFNKYFSNNAYFRHPNIIGFYGWFDDEERIFFILEYAPKGTLYNIISKGKIEESVAATVCSTYNLVLKFFNFFFHKSILFKL